MGMVFDNEVAIAQGKKNIDGTVVKQRIFDQAAIDKLVYDVLASDRGLASLASGENLSGGFNSSTKTLQTQDFLTKLIGELAIASAPEVTKEDKTERVQEKKAKTGVKTVICTELMHQGLLPRDMYLAGNLAGNQPSFTTWVGYHCWAVHVVPKMKTSSALSLALLPIVVSRYRYLTGESGLHILGRLSVWLGHPICYAIGTVINWRGGYGRANEFA